MAVAPTKAREKPGGHAMPTTAWVIAPVPRPGTKSAAVAPEKVLEEPEAMECQQSA